MSAATLSSSAIAASLVKGFSSSHYDSVTPLLLLPPLPVSLSCVLLFSHPPPFSSHREPSVEWSGGCGGQSGGVASASMCVLSLWLRLFCVCCGVVLSCVCLPSSVLCPLPGGVACVVVALECAGAVISISLCGDWWQTRDWLLSSVRRGADQSYGLLSSSASAFDLISGLVQACIHSKHIQSIISTHLSNSVTDSRSTDSSGGE